ncbi:DUF2726 domain-containing protein [Pseudobacteroides cellulosolvens]|uniref:DUF2726 domain-containing protein n=1 Tax=Pseudobacteroides cellulosolvens ATCC 35603 = DSM 2933 TaxID=398512 RepID=A0A0L6JWB2_9FIRM|nr:DUF2726 domain-containing protein [Pseudobacteroides cellulosolvens]KNY29697.1 protein of unknown function DUF2726 [Pseudobacteroides cellulosolvens ATCC 35603 = DSM 2933]
MNLVIILLIILIVISVVNLLMKKKNTEIDILPFNTNLPYKVKDNILTSTELSFYHTLQLYISDKAVICPKVGLKDIFFIIKEIDNSSYLKYFSKISQKHVDFLICEPGSMKPICGIELDDSSHTSKKSYERDNFLKKLYGDAKLELIRFSSKSGYSLSEIEVTLNHLFNKEKASTIVNTEKSLNHICPKCNIQMVHRKASKGKNIGKEFYGCPNYPNCKEIIEL